MTYTIEEMKDHAALCASIEAATGGTFEGKSGVIIDMLLSRIEVLEQDNESLRAINEDQDKALTEMEKDEKRLDWLEKSENGHGFCYAEFGEYRYYAYMNTVRQTIDTVMQSEKGGNND